LAESERVGRGRDARRKEGSERRVTRPRDTGKGQETRRMAEMGDEGERRATKRRGGS
jgi:hypothetical protein